MTARDDVATDTNAARRRFVGLALPTELATELRAAADIVFDAARWKRHEPRDLHLTLCFLGDVRDDAVEGLAHALHAALQGIRAPELVVRGLGAFPDERRPRVAWVGVHGADAEIARLVELRSRAIDAVRGAGVAFTDDERFVPHVTLARPRGRGAWPDAAGAFEFQRPWRPDRVFLFESAGHEGSERYPRRSVADLS